MKTFQLRKRVGAAFRLPAAMGLVAGAVFGFAAPAQATSAHIVNIDGVSNVAGNPVELFLGAGHYTATLLDGLHDGAPTTLFTAWFTTTTGPDGWNTGYRIELGDADVDGGSFSFSATPEEAFAATSSLTVDFLVPVDQTVGFRVRDCAGCGSDNSGGLSLEIAGVPEPSGAALVGGALLLLSGYAIRGSSPAR